MLLFLPLKLCFGVVCPCLKLFFEVGSPFLKFFSCCPKRREGLLKVYSPRLLWFRVIRGLLQYEVAGHNIFATGVVYNCNFLRWLPAGKAART